VSGEIVNVETYTEEAERDERRVLIFIARAQCTEFGDYGCFDLKAEVFKVPIHREAFNWLEKRLPRYVQPNPGPVQNLVIELRAEAAEPIDKILAIVDRIRRRAEYEHSAGAQSDQCRRGADTAHAHLDAADGAQHLIAPRLISSPSRSSGRVTTGELLRKEQNQLHGELRVFYRWRHKKGGEFAVGEFKSFIDSLRKQFAPRDPLDPNSVSGQMLGAHFKLTFAGRKQIEENETARRVDWPKRYRYRDPKPRLFRFHKLGVDPADMSPQEVAACYKAERYKRRNAERRADRQRKREVMKATYPADGYIPYDLRLINNGEQRESIYKAITAADMPVASLMATVRSNRAWQGLSDRQLYRTVINRLDDLQKEKKICSRLVVGPRGSRQRLVTRI
jgi:hypothetical protein